jgi:hypothetical protein
MRSLNDPASRSRDAQVKAFAEDGHSRRLGGRDKDIAIRGREVVKRPEVKDVLNESPTRTIRMM